MLELYVSVGEISVGRILDGMVCCLAVVVNDVQSCLKEGHLEVACVLWKCLGL